MFLFKARKEPCLFFLSYAISSLIMTKAKYLNYVLCFFCVCACDFGGWFRGYLLFFII